MHEVKMQFLTIFSKTTKQNNSQKENKHNFETTVKQNNLQKLWESSLWIEGNYTNPIQLDSLKNKFYNTRYTKNNHIIQLKFEYI